MIKKKNKIELSYLDKANPEELRYIKAYLKTGSPLESAKAAKINKQFKDRADMSHTGQAMLAKNETIRGAITQILAVEKVSVQSISHALAEEIFEKPSATSQERTVRLKAIEMVSKMLGLFDDKNIAKDTDIPIRIVMSQEEANEEEPEEPSVDLTMLENMNSVEPLERLDGN